MQEDIGPGGRTSMVRRSVTYTYKSNVRSRRYVTGVGYQRCARKVLAWAMPTSVEDWDIQACQFTLLSNLMNKLDFKLKVTSSDFHILHTCASSPDDMKRKYVPLFGPQAKHRMIAILNGGAIPTDHADNAELVALRRESRLMRWVACSVFPEAHDEAIRSKRDWPEATALFYLWTALEDQVHI